MRWWLLGCLWFAACASAPAAQPAPAPPPATAPAAAPSPPPRVGLSRPPTPAEQRLIRELMRETERIRELRFLEPVAVRIQDRAAMRQYVSEAIEEEDLLRTRRRYVALGLLDPALDVRELVESLMEEELVGYYDPEQRMLAVRDDVARSLGQRASDADLEWRATVVHELVHALQDQHLQLGRALEQERSTDAEDAFGALVEGDATLAMLGYVADKVGVSVESLAHDPEQLAANLGAGPERLTDALRAAPAIVREPLLFRYRSGALFVASLLRKGGWAAVNAAHRSPPLHTLQVLDPERYAQARDLFEISLFELDALAAAGYRAADEDVLGSLELQVALEQHARRRDEFGRGWRGDRYTILEHATGDAVVWCLRFASTALAKHAEQALGRLLEAAPRAGHLAREGTLVLLTRGLPAELHRAVERRFRSWAGNLP